MISRIIAQRLLATAAQYPVVAVLGPRQSGKTTLVRATFPGKTYLSLENLDTREYASRDPRRFLDDHPEGAILDEIQRVPDLLSYIQGIVDERGREGLYVITGSQNINVLAAVTQSLAGRVALHSLLPFALGELRGAGALPPTLNDMLFTGCYPRIHDKRLDPTEWLNNYVQTYIERDVRQVKNIIDLSTFSRFLRHCAARSGQLLHLSSLADDCGITHNTARSWISVLAAGYIVFLLQPYHRSFNKRLRKSPKLYFYDTGLLCFLLGIARAVDLAVHAHRGHIFETFVMSEIAKARFNRGLPPGMHSWQDKAGNEIDCVMDTSAGTLAVEMKAGGTITTDYFKNLQYWRKLTGAPREHCVVVYAGDAPQEREHGTVIPWRDLHRLL